MTMKAIMKVLRRVQTLNSTKNATESRLAYQMHREVENNSKTVYFSPDMQTVIIFHGVKSCDINHCIFLPQETFTPLGGKSQRKAVGVVWHEAARGRNVQDVENAYQFFSVNLPPP